MGRWTCCVFLAVLLARMGVAPAQTAAQSDPYSLKLMPDPLTLSAASPSDDESVYTMPPTPRPGEGTNLGGVNFDTSAVYVNHYIYRGVDHSITSPDASGESKTQGSTLNVKIDTKMQFDLGKFPHPYLGLFVDLYDDDPVNRFQEVRPYYGAVWTVKPFTFDTGGNTYVYPDRKQLDTAEVYEKITLDDGFIYHSDKPLLSPYFYGAYDYNKNNGWYFETGITHDVVLEDYGLTFTFQADMAYIMGYQQQFVFINQVHDTGFQHYDVGMDADYSINRLFNLSGRFGEFDLLGYLFYTGKINADLTANNVLWGGVGIGFKY